MILSDSGGLSVDPPARDPSQS